MECTSPTPILDRQKPALPHAPSHPRRPSISNLVSLSLFGLLLITVLAQIAAWALVCVIIHECGHLLAALAVGWEIRFFLAGPFAFTKESEGWRFRFLPRELLKGGRVLSVPKHAAGWSRAAAISFRPAAMYGNGMVSPAIAIKIAAKVVRIHREPA